MRRNPLREPATALKFILEFAQVDLLQLAPQRYLDTLKKVRAFIQRDRDTTDGEAVIAADLNKVPTLFQERALEILRGVATHQGATIAGDLVLTFAGVRQGSKVHFVVHGSPLDRFQYQIVRVLEKAGANRLLACPAPGCGTLFLKVTKKRFCSTRCQSRVYMQRYRAGEVGGQ
jgi:CGNR zinc finger